LGGGADGSTGFANDGVANTGGGGGGAGGDGSTKIGGNGGSGVVIIRYILFPPYSPEPTVTIGGINYTGNTLETVRITRGRTEVYEEPRAGYAIAELIDLNGNGLAIQPLQPLTITVKDGSGADIPVFTGQVSDTSAVLYDTGFESGRPGAIVTVIAVGPLARVNRRAVAAAGLPEQPDGERIADLLELALTARWEETGGTWATLADPTSTWATFDPGYDDSLIDQPGDFTIAALDPQPGGYGALSQVYLTAVSGRGVVYDTPTGLVAYADGGHRRAAALADGYQPLDPGLLIAGRLAVTSTQSDITNRAIVEYDGGTIIFSDVDSIVDYGVLAKQFQTNLANQTQAEAWALDYLEDHRRPNVKVTGVAVRLDQLTTNLVDPLLDLDVNSPVLLTGLPSTLGVTQFPAFVEGVEWRLNRQTVELLLNVSDAALSIGSQQWNQVDPTLAWEDVSATLAWIDAVEVTV
jgi:hypothetical protein